MPTDTKVDPPTPRQLGFLYDLCYLETGPFRRAYQERIRALRTSAEASALIRELRRRHGR